MIMSSIQKDDDKKVQLFSFVFEKTGMLTFSYCVHQWKLILFFRYCYLTKAILNIILGFVTIANVAQLARASDL